MNKQLRPRILGWYIKASHFQSPTKGVVYDRYGIAPCLTDYSGGGQFDPYNNRDE